MQTSSFLGLLANLLQEEETLAAGGKRRVAFTLIISKPLLPILTLFFTHLNPQDEQHARQVFDLIGTVAQRDDLFGKSSLKYMGEFIRACLAAPRIIIRQQAGGEEEEPETDDTIYIHLGRMLASWASRQGDRRKVVLDMGSGALELIHRIPDRSVAIQVLDSLFGVEEVIKELTAALKTGSGQGPYLPMLLSSLVSASLLLERLGCAFRKRLPLPEARVSILSLFKLLAKRSADPKAGSSPALYEALATLSFAEVQNDAAWSSLGEYVASELSGSEHMLQDPKLIQAILKIDLGLVIPNHLPDLLSHVEPTPAWQELVEFMVEGMARIRQLDLFCMTLAKKAPLAIPDAWVQLLVPRLRTLHVKVIEQFLKDFKQLATRRAASMPASNAFRMMGALMQAHPQTISRHVDSLLAVQSANPYYHKLLAVIAERAADPAILAQLSDYSSLHPEQEELSIVLKVRGAPLTTNVPADFTKLDDESLLRLLPVLGEVAVRSLDRIDLLPPWIFDSLLFWEAIDDELLDGLLRAKLESPAELVHILRRLPVARRPGASVAARCIKALVGQTEATTAIVNDLATDEALCKLLLVENLKLKSSLAGRLFKLGGVLARWLLVKEGLVPLEMVGTSSEESLKEMILNLTIIKNADIPKALQPKLVASLRQHLGSCTADEMPEMPLLAAVIISRFAKCPTLADEVRQRLTLAGRASFEAALLELEEPELAQPRLAETIHGFIYSPPGGGGLSTRDLGRVVKACRQPEELKGILERIRPAATNCRHQSLLDALLLLPVEIQEVAAPHVDRWLASGALLQSVTMNPGTAEACLGLLTHRLASGGTNVAALGEEDVLFGVLQLIVQLVVGQLVPPAGIPSLLTGLLQHHWILLLRYRPLLIPLLCRLMREVPERCGRLLRDFAQRHRADQQYYVLPLLLEYSELPDAADRKALRPAMAAVVAVLERARSRIETSKAPKYFNSDPLQRLMRLASSDDARLVLKELVAAYNRDYKYKGKA